MKSKIELPKIEPSEGASLLASLSWCLPLILHPGILTTSIYMAAIAQRIPHNGLLALTGTMLSVQLSVILLGYAPFSWLQKPAALRAWLRVRRELLRLSCALWLMAASLLTTTGYVMPDAILFFGIGIYCAAGMRSLDIEIVKLRETEGVERLREESRQLQKASTRTTRTIQEGG